jgi:hypothetical protein
LPVRGLVEPEIDFIPGINSTFMMVMNND